MKILKYIFLVSVIWFGARVAGAQSASGTLDLRLNYDPASALSCNILAFPTQDSTFISLECGFKSFSDPAGLLITSLLTNDLLLLEGDLDTLLLTDDQASNGIRFDTVVPNPKGYKEAVIRILDRSTQEVYTHIVNVDPEFPAQNPGIVPANKDGRIITSRYLPASGELRFQSINPEDSTLYIQRYDHEFRYAEPPMTVELNPGSKLMKIDTTFRIYIDSVLSLEPGLYLIQNDTNSREGISFIVRDSYYPKLVKPEHLVKTLRYLTTSKEWEELELAENPKRGLDRFWLKVGGSSQNARNLIREYYARVSEANMFFTTYKEGWKTDRGMLYIIWGPPDRVFRKDDSEVWIYNKSDYLPQMKFQFLQTNNIFNEDFVLARSKEYRIYWFRKLDLWRKGIR